MLSSPLRVAVTPPSGHEAIRQQAQRALGVDVDLIVLPTEALFAALLSRPEDVDLAQVEMWMIGDLVARGIVQPLDTSEIRRFDEIDPLFTHGKVDDRAVPGYGAAPWRRIYAQGSGPCLNAVPTICNCDTLGWREDLTAEPIRSWADLLAPRVRGRVGVADMPAVSHVELSMALSAAGLISYGDIGEQSAAEIDGTYALLGDLARDGQFSGLWGSYEASVTAMAEGRVAVQSCWPPAIAALRRMGIPVRYTMLEEGGRGWAGGLALMAHLVSERREMAIEYINWYLDGWPGAYLMRQGYYPSTPSAARAHLSGAEWDFWYEGAPALHPIQGTDGAEIGQIGERREGGAFVDRMGRIACWNTRMIEEARIRQHWDIFRQQIRTVCGRGTHSC